MKVPYMARAGAPRGGGGHGHAAHPRPREAQEALPLEAFVARVREEIATRALTPVADVAAKPEAPPAG